MADPQIHHAASAMQSAREQILIIHGADMAGDDIAILDAITKALVDLDTAKRALVDLQAERRLHLHNLLP